MAAKRRPLGKRNKRPTPAQAADELRIEAMRQRATELRLQGKSYRAIAAEMGCNESTAYYYVKAVLQRTIDTADETAAELRRVELERIDAIIAALTPDLSGIDSETRARASRELLRASESRRKLLGLDAPEKLEHDVRGNLADILALGFEPDPAGGQKPTGSVA